MPGNDTVSQNAEFGRLLRTFAIREGKLVAAEDYIEKREHYIRLLQQQLIDVQAIHDHVESTFSSNIAEHLPEMPPYAITLSPAFARAHAIAVLQNPVNSLYTRAELQVVLESLRIRLQQAGERIVLQTATIDDLANQIDAVKNACLMTAAIGAERLARWTLESSFMSANLSQFRYVEDMPVEVLTQEDFTARFLL